MSLQCSACIAIAEGIIRYHHCNPLPPRIHLLYEPADAGHHLCRPQGKPCPPVSPPPFLPLALPPLPPPPEVLLHGKHTANTHCSSRGSKHWCTLLFLQLVVQAAAVLVHIVKSNMHHTTSLFELVFAAKPLDSMVTEHMMTATSIALQHRINASVEQRC